VKINDALTGAALLALGLVILWHIQGFPAMPGQRFGPAWFPGIIAAGLAGCGLVLVVQGVRSRAPWVALDEWTRRSRPLAGFASIIWWLRVLGARWPLTLAVAIAAPILLHLAFYKVLRVPLPWGVLERFAF
jgi:putative tricarboxylic transport membrane protein